MSALDLFNFLKNFNNLSDQEQREVTLALDQLVDAVANGVWDKEMTDHRQCHFCCRSPHSDHMDSCPVEVARKFRETHLDYLNKC